jgi:hypothetical protein
MGDLLNNFLNKISAGKSKIFFTMEADFSKIKKSGETPENLFYC